MDSPIYIQWQQWERRVQDWLANPKDDLDLFDTLPFDRVILTILAVKYQLQYTDLDKEMAGATMEQQNEDKTTVKLRKAKVTDAQENNEHHRGKEKLFDDYIGRLLSPQEVTTEDSAEWQEFNQLYEWHGLAFLRRFEKCLRQFVSQLISTTPAYQELICQPKIVSPVAKINNEVYEKKNNGQIFLSVDIKSANFAVLQHIHAIDAQTYPTWSDFLSSFVGSRPFFTRSKKLRMKCLGKLPEYHKLEALWGHFTAVTYRKTLCSYFDEIDVNRTCVALTGDEVVFRLDISLKEQALIDIMHNLQKRLLTDSPIIKFHVQIYRLQTFHWRGKNMCFARMFIGQDNGQFDLKCVPDKDRNYATACEDFRKLSGL